jgi:hypothetical protein
MDSQNLSLALAALCAAPLAWVACGAVVTVGKRTSQLSRSVPPVKKPSAVKVQGVVSLLGLALLETFAAVLHTILGLVRTLMSFIPLLFLFAFTVLVWYTVSSHNVQLVYTVDALYERFRPTIVELYLQILNFTRVVFALLVGVWNASLSLKLRSSRCAPCSTPGTSVVMRVL